MKVLLIAPTFGSPLHISTLEHFKKLMKSENFSFRSATGEIDKQIECFHKALVENKPDVLISFDVSPSEDIVLLYRENNIPIILVDEETRGATTIATDNYAGGHIVGKYLISKGKKKIAIITGTTEGPGSYNARLRLEGFKQALAEHNLTLPSYYTLVAPKYTREDGIELMPKLIEEKVDAIFCAAGDNCAQGLLAVAREQKVRVPEDIAIVGFDDLPIAKLSTPELTTVRQPIKEIVDTAYRLAIEETKSILYNPRKILFKPELIIRQSA